MADLAKTNTDHYGLELPDWVSESVRRYLAHTELGLSIRHIARIAGCHPSTVLRQVRRIESLRDGPLMDRAMQEIAMQRVGRMTAADPYGTQEHEEPEMGMFSGDQAVSFTEDHLQSGALPILQKLVQPGAVLAVADAMDRAVVVREDADGQTLRTAVVDCQLAQAMALNNWITCDKPGRISRYRISGDGRAALTRLLAASEQEAQAEATGFADAQAGFDHAPGTQRAARRSRYSSVDSPLAALARRRDKDGSPFLEPQLVAAGERLREDFELAQIEQGPRGASARFDPMAMAMSGAPMDPTVSGARARVTAALTDLGPGLADVVLRCCCHLEGLEAAEKALGWSARSGKIVLRIGLQQLARFYERAGADGKMIG